jgi:DNA polymerase
VTPVLTLDFETRSHCDLVASGLANYADHPTTEPWCMAWAFDDEEPAIWTLGEPLPARVAEPVLAGGTVVAHNAAFEYLIWNRVCVRRYGWPRLELTQVVDTMVEAYAMALPGALDNACPAVGLPWKKDPAGHKMMRFLCEPDEAGNWKDTPERLAILYKYCKEDVVGERELYKRLCRLSPQEAGYWRLDQCINQRGFYVDVPAIRAAAKIVKSETLLLNDRLSKVTGGYVTAVSNPGQLKDWLATKHGIETNSLDKAAVTELLANPELPDTARQALLIRQDGAKASTAKLDKLLARVSADGRVRGTKQFHGAATGRWAGRDVQPDNFPRQNEATDYEEVLRLIMAGDVDAIDMVYGPPLKIVSEAMRSTICAPEGKVLYGGDFSNIEGRGLAWCAGEEWKLEAFRAFDAGTGPDLYKVTYARSFNCDLNAVTKALRQVGKVQELALGYQGAYGALCTMAAAYGVEVPPQPPKYWIDDADHPEGGKWVQPKHPWVKTWRDAHPKTERWWYDLEDAARNAIAFPGQLFSAGPAGREVYYRMKGSFLWCKLQSGRVLCYPYARIGAATTPWGIKPNAILYRYVNQTTRKWEEGPTYGGSLAENIVQALARDILAAAMPRLENVGYEVVLHVHDEAISERDAGQGSVEEFTRLMTVVPEWAAGWPISVGAWTGRRWQK